MMTKSDYIKTRLDNQIEWYSKKSKHNKKIYNILQCIEIIIAALSPVIGCIGLAYWNYSVHTTIALSAIGAGIAIIEGVEKIGKYHENWIQYRYIAELLKHEKYLFETETEPYDNDNAFSTLVQRVERTISSENVNWVGINNDNKKAS